LYVCSLVNHIQYYEIILYWITHSKSVTFIFLIIWNLPLCFCVQSAKLSYGDRYLVRICLRECRCTNKAGSFSCIIGHLHDLKSLSVHLFSSVYWAYIPKVWLCVCYRNNNEPLKLTWPALCLIVSHSFYISHEWVRNRNQYYWYTYDYSKVQEISVWTKNEGHWKCGCALFLAGFCLQVCGYVAFHDRCATRSFIQWHWGWQIQGKGSLLASLTHPLQRP